MNKIKNKNFKINKTTLSILLVISAMHSNFSMAAKDSDIIEPTVIYTIQSGYHVNDMIFDIIEKDYATVTLSFDSFDNTLIPIKEMESKYSTVYKIPNIFAEELLFKNVIVDKFDTTLENYEFYKTGENYYIKFNFKSKSTVDFEIYDNKLVFDIKKENELDKSKEKKYIGENVSLDFDDFSVRQAIHVLSKYTKFNLVTTDTVMGNITISLKDVPFDHALDIILKSKGLDKIITDNIVFIAPSGELAKMEEDRLTKLNKINDLSQLDTQFVQIKYAKAIDLNRILSPILSSRGSIITDERTNTLIIKDIDKITEKAKEIVKKLDIPVKQVLIESRIVVAKKTTNKEIGAKLGGALYNGSTYVGSDYSTVVEQFTNDEFKLNPNFLTVGTNPLSNLGVNNSNAGRIGFGIKTNTGLIDLELSALEEKGDAEVIARPKIVTADKKTAIVKSGREIPYQSSTGTTGATTTSFKDAVMSLEVTPQITPNGKIIMDLKINQDSVGENTDNGPSIDTTEINTQILVDNGETIVLGGIYQSNKLVSIKSIPLLGDLPAIGQLFRNKSEEEEKTELLFFITPKLMSNDEINE